MSIAWDELGRCEEDVEAGEIPEVEGSEAAFARYIDAARAIPKGDIIGYRGNPSLAFHNVDRGTKAVMAKLDIVEKLPDIDAKALLDLPNLALAVVHAAAIAARSHEDMPKSNYRPLLSRANTLRRIMLLSLEACAAAEVIPSEGVQAIRAGTGVLDRAEDVIALVDLYRKHEAALRDKTPITPALLREASQVGTELLTFIKPKGTPIVKEARTPQQAEDDRDRLWTLLVRGHDELSRVASFVFGREATEHVPQLHSRLRSAPKPVAVTE